MADILKEALDNVREFPRKKEAPALGMSVVMNIPGERQITLQSFVAVDESLEVQNALADRMNMIADRQRSKYLIKDFEAELASKLDEIKFRQVDYQRQVEARDKRIAEANERISVFKEQVDEITKEGYEAHVAAGRAGAYTPKGQIVSRINGATAAAKMEEDKIKKVMEEWTQWEQSFQSTLDAANSKIEELKSAIRHCETAINPPKASEEDGA